MKQRKPVNVMMFDNKANKYPRGLRVTDPDELDEMMKSGKWNTGPVDAAKSKKVAIAEKERLALAKAKI